MAGAQIQPRVSEVSFKFDVPNVRALRSVMSPKFHVYGVPWQVNVEKQDRNGEPRLFTSLFCAKKDSSPQWTHAAFARFKLLSFANNVNPIEGCSWPNVYDYKELGYGAEIIHWNDLFDSTKQYVKDDTLKLKVKIEMADPYEPEKSKLVLEEIGKSCADRCSTKFRLSVTNIENLMAVRSAPFALQNESWYLAAFKFPSSGEFGIRLGCLTSSQTYLCDIKMLVKLVSLKPGGKQIEQEQMEQKMGQYENVVTDNFVSWDELSNPNNGFMNNNTVVFEVEIKSQMSAGIISSATKRKATSSSASEAKRYEMACTICCKRFEGQSVSSTNCGHLFCTSCITNAITTHKECPTCKTALRMNEVRRAHLPL